MKSKRTKTYTLQKNYSSWSPISFDPGEFNFLFFEGKPIIFVLKSEKLRAPGSKLIGGSLE
jgi:hypothetical protein